MRIVSNLLIISAAFAATAANAEHHESAEMESAITYPETMREELVEEHFGTAVPDPYRWLENDVRNDPRVRDWVTEQNAVTDAYLETLPGREAIAERLTELWNYERVGVPRKRGSRYFYTRNDGLQNQSVLVMREGIDGEETLLIDPNQWSDDDATAMAQWEASPDGTRIAYGVQDGGTDWRTIRVLDIASGETLEDTVEWAKFTGISWAHNGAGFFYSRFPEPSEEGEFQSLNANHSIYFHAIGTAQDADRLVYATPDRPGLNHNAEVTDDGHYLVIYSSEGTDSRYEVNIVDLTSPAMERRTIVRGLDHNWDLAGSQGDIFWFVTNMDAPRERIVRMDVSTEARAITEIVAEDAATLEGASIVGDRLIANYLVDARNEARLFDLDGNRTGTVDLPGIGSAGGFDGKPGDSETFFFFESFASPAAIYRFDSETAAVTPFAIPELTFNPDDYTVSQRFYTSRDGTRIPMFLVHRADLDMSESHPTLLYGYGGFNISLTPDFSPGRLQ